jgi:hypothetical protein
VKSQGLAIWSYACGTEFGSVHLVPSAAGFDIEANDDGKPGRSEAIRIFTKAPDAPITAIQPAVQAASPGPAIAKCTLEESKAPDGSLRERYALKPPAAIQAAWDKAMETGDPGDPPCGAYGPQLAGAHTFELVDGAPDKVVLVNWGSEIQIFDPSTLRAAE